MEEIRHDGPLTLVVQVSEYKMTDDGIQIKVCIHAEAKKGILDGAKYPLIESWTSLDNPSAFLVKNLYGKVAWDPNNPEVAHVRKPENDS